MAAALTSACVEPVEPPSGPAIVMGALLPFTGDLAVSGNNIEQALLLGAEEINASGGVCGLPVRIESRDTHSDATKGLIAASDLVQRAGARILIGPDEEEVASLVVPTLEAQGVLLISGGLVSPLITRLEPPDLWFRISPPPSLLGKALVKRMSREGRKSAVILSVDDEYGGGMANIIGRAMDAEGIVRLAEESFPPIASTFQPMIQRSLARSPDAVVLVAYPSSGAKLVQEMAIVGGVPPLYLSPTLRSEQFARNVPPGALDRAVGVSLGVLAESRSFVVRYAERWSGDVPLTSSFFYLDALMIAALATQKACATRGSYPPVEAIRDSIRDVANAPGTAVDWDESGGTLALLDAGQDIDYRGISSKVEIGLDGAAIGGFYRYWRFVGGAVQEE